MKEYYATVIYEDEEYDYIHRRTAKIGSLTDEELELFKTKTGYTCFLENAPDSRPGDTVIVLLREVRPRSASEQFDIHEEMSRGGNDPHLRQLRNIADRIRSIRGNKLVEWASKSPLNALLGKAGETEYFVSYYETLYPKCCQVFKDDTHGRSIQDGKSCFSSSCGDCTGGGPECNWSDCHSNPYLCITDPCPESKQKLYWRVSIGCLTLEELAAFKEMTGIENTPGFSLLLGEEVKRLSLVEKVEHKNAVERHGEEVSRRSIPGWDVPF